MERIIEKIEGCLGENFPAGIVFITLLVVGITIGIILNSTFLALLSIGGSAALVDFLSDPLKTRLDGDQDEHSC